MFAGNLLIVLCAASLFLSLSSCRSAKLKADSLEAKPTANIQSAPSRTTTNLNIVRLPTVKTGKPPQRIKEIAYHSSLLWMLGADGNLSTLDLQNRQLSKIDFGGLITDLYVSPDKELYLLGRKRNSLRAIRILRKDGDAWREFKPLEQSEKAAGAFKHPSAGVTFYRGQPLVLTGEAVYSLKDSGEWLEVRLETAGKFYHQNRLAATDDGFVYSGLNNGEWGGGLQQIEIETGKVKTIQKIEKGGICGSPLDADCDPVTGVIRDAENPSCVIASVGMSHMMEHGRLLKVCGSEVAEIFSKSHKVKFGENELEYTEAFFDLVAADSSYFAVTRKGVYQFAKGENASFFELPRLAEISGVTTSEAIPGIIVVSTDINGAASLSGYTPLIAVKN